MSFLNIKTMKVIQVVSQGRQDTIIAVNDLVRQEAWTSAAMMLVFPA